LVNHRTEGLETIVPPLAVQAGDKFNFVDRKVKTAVPGFDDQQGK
jgi:hypothetical protein